MPTETFTVRVDSKVKKRLEKLAKMTGRSRSFLAAEALDQYVEVNEWQVERIKKGLKSLDRGESAPHSDVKAWVESWGTKNELPMPRPRRK